MILRILTKLASNFAKEPVLNQPHYGCKAVKALCYVLLISLDETFLQLKNQ